MFRNYKQRCHALGNLMTNLNSITDGQLDKIATLEKRRDLAISDPTQAKPLTATMEETLSDLIGKRDAPDALPAGAKSYLDTVFRELYWGRKRLLDNRYLSKGLFGEQDSLKLMGHKERHLVLKNK